MGGEQLGGPVLGFAEQACHFFVDGPLGVFGVGPGAEPVVAQVARARPC